MPHNVAKFAFLKKALIKYLKLNISSKNQFIICTNPSINAEIARASNGVTITVISEAGNIPPNFKTTKT